MREQRPDPGSSVVTEGEIGDCFYIVAAGCAEVTAQGIALNRLAEGDVFGEVALLTPEAKRTATVRAGKGLILFALPASDFHRLLAAHPEVASYFETAARQLLARSFLKLASPFSGSDSGRLMELAKGTETLFVPAGEVILREGDEGDRAYCVVAGRVEVLRGTPQAPVAELGTGALFGEAAQLTGAPRNATVRAMEPCELLVLRRDTLIKVMDGDPRAAAACLSLLRLRERPRRRPEVELQEGKGTDGSPFFVLADRPRGRYFRLSTEGKFVWDRLDGEHDLKAIVIEFFMAFKRFAPDMLAGLVTALAEAGFVQLRPLAADVAGVPIRWWQRMIIGLRSRLDRQVALTGCDSWLSGLYGSGIHRLYRRPAVWSMTLAIVLGAGAFVLRAGDALAAIRAAALPALAWWLLPAGLLAMLAHECGHAFTVKAFGKEVHRLGIGWYWVTPVLFVDTSEMWRARKWQRAAVSAAGVYVNLVLAGLAALASCFVHAQVLAGVWLFAALSYLAVFLNLCPIGGFDGYHLLTDSLDRPNLRRDTIRLIRERKSFKAHRAELSYCVAVILYLLGASGLFLTLAPAESFSMLAKGLANAASY